MLSQNAPFRQDVRFVGLISNFPLILEACATATGMVFIAVARLSEDRRMELAPPLAASQDIRDDAGSNATCRTVSGNWGKVLPRQQALVRAARRGR